MSRRALAAPGERKNIGALLRDPNYLAFWCVGGLIGVTRWFQLLALGVYAFETTRSPLLVSVVPLLSMSPLALCGPLIGAVADRLDRKLLFVGVLAGIGIVSAGMAGLAWSGDFQFVHVAIAAFLNGVLWATDMPVRRRLLGDLSGDALPAAMSLDAATGNATRMLGPLLGGVILQYMGVLGVFLFSAFAYALCLMLVVAVRVSAQDRPTAPSSLLHDLVAGGRYVRADARLRRILAITVGFNLFGFPFTSMIPVIGQMQLGLDPFWVGALSSLEGLGAFLGALFVAVTARPGNYFAIYWRGTIVYISVVGVFAGVAFFAVALPAPFLAAAAALVVIGIAGACFAAMQSTLTYLGAAPQYRSRVLGVLTLCIGAGPIGFFNVGWMADLWGAPTALFIMSLEGLFLLLLLWLRAPGGIYGLEQR